MATRHKLPVGWRNRIVGSGVQRADQFVASPDNWRRHPSSQEEALVGVLDQVGWVQEVIVSKRSGYVIDGHLRVAAAIRKDDATPVPFKEVDVSEAEEALLLSVIDPISALAGTDQAKYDELVSLLPENLALLAQLAKGQRFPETKTVQFTAQETFKVVVDCADAETQERLLARLTSEGFACHG